MNILRDYIPELELNHRRQMEVSSERLLNALRAEHPHIIAHLTRRVR